MRLAPLGLLAGKLLNFDLSDDVQEHLPGTIVAAQGTDYSTTSGCPNWGACEVMYVRNNTSSTFNPGRLVHVDKDFNILDMPNTANTGRPVFVALTRFAAGDTTTQYGWVLRAGVVPIQVSAAYTLAGPVYFAAAGQATHTATAGKQLLNATGLLLSAGTHTKTVQTRNGSPQVGIPNAAGVFVGQAISGTGIPASSVVSSIDPAGRFVVIGSAVGTPVNATASGSVTGTFTNTNFVIAHIDRPFVQGQIT